jgi:hypothetical protein
MKMKEEKKEKQKKGKRNHRHIVDGNVYLVHCSDDCCYYSFTCLLPFFSQNSSIPATSTKLTSSFTKLLLC